jgi:hypothetical protein
MPSRLTRLLLAVLVLAGLLPLSVCEPAPASAGWRAADLRRLDPADAPQPALDLLAASLHSTPLAVEVRIDLLDLDARDEYAFRFTIWDEAAFRLEPMIVEIHNGGWMRTRLPDGAPALRARFVPDFELDTLVVGLNRHLLHGNVRVAVESLENGMTVDRIEPFDANTPPPLQRAPVVLAFREAYPAYTPAQALRRWDGAHTGPTGERHGLVHIVEAAGRTRLPVFLLDLKTPSSLAALHAMDLDGRLRRLAEAGILVLPDVAWSEPAWLALDAGLVAAAGFDLRSSPYVYAAGGDLQSGYTAQFVSLPDASHLGRAGGQLLIPLPVDGQDQATASGPSLELRRRLIATALSADNSDLLVLGGSLPDSTWGDSDMAGPTFAWLAGHAWVQVLSGTGLLTFPTQPVALPGTETPVDPAAAVWLEELRQAPDNALTGSAWQAFLSLSAPTDDPALAALHRTYLGQTGILLAAAQWAENPQALNDCSADPDRDGQPECLLSDGRLLAVFETDGAVLSNLFSVQADGPHQWIGPSSQFAVGLSDPSEWRPERGPAADPSALPGAFFDTPAPWQAYRVESLPDGLRFSSTDGSRIKTFRLVEGRLEVRYKSDAPVSTRIPLAVDPLGFYRGPVGYRAVLGSGSWTWGQEGGAQVEVRTQAALRAQGFTVSLPYLSLPEDPDLAYPSGHYLPYPLSLVTVSGSGDFSVEVRLQEAIVKFRPLW